MTRSTTGWDRPTLPTGFQLFARRFLALWLAGGIAALAVDVALAELVHTTEYRTHAVRGTTPKAILGYMNAHPIIDPDDGPAYANLTHDHVLSLDIASEGGICRVSTLTFRWRFVLTLPHAVDEPAMDSETRSLWNDFVAALKHHEETHRAIFLHCGARFVPAAERMTGAGNCDGLERKVGRSIDQAYRACMADQRAFEKRDRPRILGLAFVRAARSH
jgi:predicted secreted Zn-dependent protease